MIYSITYNNRIRPFDLYKDEEFQKPVGTHDYHQHHLWVQFKQFVEFGKVL
jgi:hypothetical protein